MGRRLIVRKESLAALETDELSQVAGAVPWTPGCPLTLRIAELIDDVTQRVCQ